LDNGTTGDGLIIAYIMRFNQKNSWQVEKGRILIFAYAHLVRFSSLSCARNGLELEKLASQIA